MNKVFLLTGGNLGNRLHNLQKAVEWVERECGRIVSQSSVYETAPWGFSEQPLFLNQALEIETQLLPQDLLKNILQIEEQMGRRRVMKLGPRVIDIDILLMDDLVLESAQLTIPHPHMKERRFVLMPLAEIAGEIIHPVFLKPINELLEACTDTLSVYKFLRGK